VTRFVLDAPTLLHVVTEGLVVSPAHALVAPNSIRSKALELMLGEVRAGRLTDAEAMERHERMTELRMRLLGDRVSRRTAWRIAREHDGMTIAAAEYVAVTRLQADALVTVDDELAALASGLVPTAPGSALTEG
jgi:predicted nucleic acid-binding protein